jgi:WD40 repeat protein
MDYKEHGTRVWSVDLLVSASTDNTLKLWDLSNFGEKKHDSESHP